MASKEILYGKEARDKMLAGINKAADAVAPTLGAIGMTAIIDWEGLDPIVSDDGVTILKNLEFKDKIENMALKMLRKAAIRTSLEGGDGTATTTVLARAIANEAAKEVKVDGSNIQEVRERLEKGLPHVISLLSQSKREVSEDDIERIATISSLDTEVAKLIANIIKEIGVNGVVTVEKGSKIGYSSEVVKGLRFDKGLISQYFINDFEKEVCVLENPYILLVDRRISINEQIKSVMDSVQKTGNKSILIIADDVDGLALASLTQNSKSVRTMLPNGQVNQGTWDIACVKNPFTASRAKDFLADVAVLTGGTVISEEAGMRLDNVTVTQCGIAEKVIVSKDNCTIIGGQQSDALQSRITSIKTQLEESTSDYAKLLLEERLAGLTGGIGVVRVGAYTDTDFNAKKYKFENAINSTQAALQEGIVIGGGSALAKIATFDIDPIFKRAIVKPFVQQAINAGMGHETILGRNKALKEVQNHGMNIGMNFKTKQIENLFDTGVVDPFKVTRLALESAVSIALSVVTAQTAIVNEE